MRGTSKTTEASAETYDRHFSQSEKADRHYSLSIQHRLYRRVCHELEALASQSILEVGCGTGAFAHCLMDTLSREYRGFDFSEVAVRMARARTRHGECFFVADARHSISYEHTYDTIVCLEVLEHIERDLDVIVNWHPGCHCICSVPNFDYPTHVRWFRHEAEIAGRYGASDLNSQNRACPLPSDTGPRVEVLFAPIALESE